MSRQDPITIIIGAILSPFILFYDLVVGRLIALITGITGLVWYCYVELPMKFGEFQEKIQVSQYALDIFHNITTQQLHQGVLQSISPFAGILSILLGGILIYCFRDILIESLSIIARSL
jgi:hypothetical protein